MMRLNSVDAKTTRKTILRTGGMAVLAWCQKPRLFSPNIRDAVPQRLDLARD